MTLRRAQILAAVQAMVTSTMPLPGVVNVFPSNVTVDSVETENFVAVSGADLSHTANIIAGDFEPSFAAGPEDDWEGARDITVAYAVQGSDKDLRTARAALAVPYLEAAVAADRTLGLGDLQVYAQITEAREDDGIITADAVEAVAGTFVTINVLYVAASAAG